MKKNQLPIRIVITCIVFVFCASTLLAQTFTEQMGIPLTGVSGHTEAWGDYNNDGNLDLLVAGNDGTSSSVKLYRNNGDNTFTWQSTVTFAVDIVYDVAWGDFDNDGDLDILIASTLNSKLYENKGDGSFVLKANLPEVFMGKCIWADLNNDGYRDIILTGSGSESTKLLKNNQDGTFTEQANTIPAVSNYSSVACGDDDNDGDLDILIAGLNNGTEITKVYRNDGGFTFTEQTGVVLPGIANCAVAWADIDNDGDLDIVLSGAASAFTNKIYENKGNNTFAVMVGATFQDLYRSSMDIADYDNDGYKDIIIAGSTNGSDYYTNIYRNNKNKTFTKITTETIPGVQFGTIKFGDFDNDGKLDLFVCGNSSGGKIAKIFKNGTSIANTAPTIPTNLHNGSNINQIILYWSESTDMEGSKSGLSYNLYIYRYGSASYKCSPQSFRQSDSKNGKSFIVKTADIQRIISGGGKYTITGLPEGNYKWSVQAVDAGLKSGNFASEGSFIVADKNIFAKQTGILLDTVNESSVAWGDYNNDGFSDILLTGNSDNFTNTAISKIYKNNGDGTFTWQQGIVLPGVLYSSVAWGDFNNDNYLDILLTGHTFNGPISRVYKNNGDGTFTEQTGMVLPNVDHSAVAWIDYNNDGYQDILLTGNSSVGRITKLFKNNRNGSFTEQTGIVLPGVSDGSISWGDFNNDGFQDLLLSGTRDDNNTLISGLYKNNGNGSFTKLGLSLPGAMYSSAAWGDYDSDGYLDFALQGYNNSSTFKCAIYKNNGDETFSEQTQIWLFNNYSGTLTWGDYNNDGYLDLLSTGGIGSFLYRNTGENNFTYFNNILPSAAYGSPNVGYTDYDNDGKIDLLFTGLNASTSRVYGNVFKNVGNYVSNSRPSIPGNLSQSVSGASVKLSWDKSSDNETSQSGLSYNIYVCNADNGLFVKSPQSMMDGAAKGRRLIYHAGDIQKGSSSYSLNDLPTGNYQWSVQSIDGINAGSEFAPESLFSIVLGNETAVNVAENLLTQTRTDIEYSINSTNGIDGIWQLCTTPNTAVNYGSGGFDVWIRLASAPTTMRKVATIAPPAAAPSFTINYLKETTNEIASTATDYAINADMTGFLTVNNTTLPIFPGKTNYIRIKATSTTLASNIQQLPVPARPAIPFYSINYCGKATKENVPATDQYATNYAMYSPHTGSNSTVSVTAGQFLYFRTKATSFAFASDIQTLAVPSPPAAPVYTIDYMNERTNELFIDYYNTDGSESTWTGLSSGPDRYLYLTPGQNLYMMSECNETAFRSVSKLFLVPTPPVAPANPLVDDAANTFDWTNVPTFVNPSDYEITKDGYNWSTCSAKPYQIGNIKLDAGSVKVRVKASSSNFKGVALASNAAYSLSTGINDLKDAGILLFPNPVADVLYIKNAPAMSKVSIFTIDGKLIKGNLSISDTNEILVNDLPSGLLLIKIKTGKTEVQGKFVKK